MDSLTERSAPNALQQSGFLASHFHQNFTGLRLAFGSKACDLTVDRMDIVPRVASPEHPLYCGCGSDWRCADWVGGCDALAWLVPSLFALDADANCDCRYFDELT